MTVCCKELWCTQLASLAQEGGIVLEVNLGSFNTRRPSSAWKDSSAYNSEWLSTQFSEPGIMQLSMMLRDNSGLSSPWKAPS